MVYVYRYHQRHLITDIIRAHIHREIWIQISLILIVSVYFSLMGAGWVGGWCGGPDLLHSLWIRPCWKSANCKDVCKGGGALGGGKKHPINKKGHPSQTHAALKPPPPPPPNPKTCLRPWLVFCALSWRLWHGRKAGYNRRHKSLELRPSHTRRSGGVLIASDLWKRSVKRRTRCLILCNVSDWWTYKQTPWATVEHWWHSREDPLLMLYTDSV